MKTRVLFFDDEPAMNKKLARSLEERGYTLCTPTNLAEALYEINMNKAELLIHSAHRTETYWDIVRQIFEMYPQFPSIHFATGFKAEEFAKGWKGPYHQKLRPLLPERDFLRRVRKLIFIGRMNRENLALRKSLALHRKLDGLFETLDLWDLKERIVNFMGSQFRSENAYFLSPGGYGYYLQEMWKVSPINQPDGENQSKHQLVSSQPSTEKQLSDLLNKLTEFLPRDWELKKDRSIVKATGKLEKTCCLVPLIGHQTKKILGHLLLVNPLLIGDAGLEKTLPDICQTLGRHLEHVTNYSGAKSLSYVDDLTELYNQRYLKLVLDKEINRCSRSKSNFSVLFMDIDHFKTVNDTKGHLIGSRVLVELSKILHQNIRTMDYGFRYGGDEFILILVGTGSEQAFAIAERIRRTVENSVFTVSGIKIKVTLSIGIATFPDHATTRDQIIELADRAMYCGKNKSRNVVYVAS